ncbi:hypothetical protein HUJ05_011838 [Dendroctonus ponderosae]|nr:hypothetical protein HUJ05_011838 [Dendroctonus ponderosae]
MLCLSVLHTPFRMQQYTYAVLYLTNEYLFVKMYIVCAGLLLRLWELEARQHQNIIFENLTSILNRTTKPNKIYKIVYTVLEIYERSAHELRLLKLSTNANPEVLKLGMRNTYLGKLEREIQLTKTELITELRGFGKITRKLLSRIKSTNNLKLFDFKIDATRMNLLDAFLRNQLRRFLKVGAKKLVFARKSLRKRKQKKLPKGIGKI